MRVNSLKSSPDHFRVMFGLASSQVARPTCGLANWARSHCHHRTRPQFGKSFQEPGMLLNEAKQPSRSCFGGSGTPKIAP